MPVPCIALCRLHRTHTSEALPLCCRFYIVTYALAIFNLNLLLGFLTPQVDPELEGPTLPSKSDEEFRPFVRKLPEFKAWCVLLVWGSRRGGFW